VEIENNLLAIVCVVNRNVMGLVLGQAQLEKHIWLYLSALLLFLSSLSMYLKQDYISLLEIAIYSII
jgi:hypothetical protein